MCHTRFAHAVTHSLSCLASLLSNSYQKVPKVEARRREKRERERKRAEKQTVSPSQSRNDLIPEAREREKERIIQTLGEQDVISCVNSLKYKIAFGQESSESYVTYTLPLFSRSNWTTTT